MGPENKSLRPHYFLYNSCFVIFFLSGASALIYEVLWFRLASLVFGNSVWGAALVLSGFMAGLALGSYLVARYGHRVTSPMLMYAVMEITIGCAGFLVVVILPGLQEAFSLLFRPLLDHLLLLNLFRLLLVFIILLLPTMVMGATLPMMVKALVNLDKDFGTALGSLYGINTLGAVTGVLVCEYLLIKVLGIRNSGMLAAGINLVAAAVAFRLVPYLENITRSTRIGAEPASIKLILITANRNLLVSAFLSGMVLLALEIVWFRFLQLFQFGTSQIFATMLAIVLSGISAGGFLASFCHRKKIITENHINVLALTGGFLTLMTYIFFDEFYSSLSLLPLSTFTSLLLYNFFLMFPVSVVSGVLFTLLGIAIRKNDMTDTGAAGLLILVNTIGAMCGSLLAGFVLLPVLGMENSFYILALCYGLIALLVSRRHATTESENNIMKPALVAAAAYLTGLVFFPFGEMHGIYFKQLAERFGASRIIDIREGAVATNINLAYDFYGKPYFYKLVTNNHSMTATSVYSRRYMKLFVYLPVAIHPGIDNALLISFGQGSTAKALVDTESIRSIDIVDISRDIIGMSNQIYTEDGNPIMDKRVNVHIEDGRFFLLTTPRQYDLITAEPPPPKAIGVVNLYTQEYFKLVHERLREQGIATYWLPTQSLTPSDSKVIIKAFCNVFSDCSLWNGASMDWILMGTKNLTGPVSAQHFSGQWQNPGVLRELKTVGLENAAQLGATFIADADFLNKLAANSMPLTDNHPLRLSQYTNDLSGDGNSAFYYPLMEEAGAEYRFAHSNYIRKIWPHTWRQQALDYFKYQRLLNKQFITSYRGKDDHPLNDLHEVLTHASLESLPLWMMRSDDDKQEIIRRLITENARIPAIPLHLALLSISQRDFAAALARLDEYLKLEAGEGDASAYTLYLYLLCMTGQTVKANTYLQEIISLFPPNERNRVFIAWFRDKFGLDIPGAYMH